MLRGVLDHIAVAGGLKGKVHRQALDLLDAFARGEVIAPEAFEMARAEIAKLVGRIGIGSPPLLLALSCVPVELLIRMAEQGDDFSGDLFQHAEHALSRAALPEAAKRIEELRAQAAAQVTVIDDAPFPAPHRSVDPGPLDLDLPPIAMTYLSNHGAARTADRGDAEETAAALASRGYVAHPAVLAFEAAYGGLELFESDPNAAALMAGPFAFFTSSPNYTGKAGGLVPVAAAWNDVCYALDAKGRGFTKAGMVEGVFRPSAHDGRALLTQAILWRALEAHPRSFVAREGLHGSVMAKERKVARIKGATGETERWWGDGDARQLVVEIDRGNGYEKPMTYATVAG